MTTPIADRIADAPKPGGIDFANWSYNTLPERTGNVGWQPDLQDLIYTAINHVEGDYEDADENAAEQVIERLVLALKTELAASEARVKQARREGMEAAAKCAERLHDADCGDIMEYVFAGKQIAKSIRALIAQEGETK